MMQKKLTKSCHLTPVRRDHHLTKRKWGASTLVFHRKFNREWLHQIPTLLCQTMRRIVRNEKRLRRRQTDWPRPSTSNSWSDNTIDAFRSESCSRRRLKESFYWLRCAKRCSEDSCSYTGTSDWRNMLSLFLNPDVKVKMRLKTCSRMTLICCRRFRACSTKDVILKLSLKPSAQMKSMKFQTLVAAMMIMIDR